MNQTVFCQQGNQNKMTNSIKLEKLAPSKFRIVVTVADHTGPLRNELVRLGYELVPGLANTWSTVVTSAAEMDAKRDSLRVFFS